MKEVLETCRALSLGGGHHSPRSLTRPAVVITHIKDELYPSSPPPTASPSPSKSAVGAAANMSPTSSPPETVHERIERELNELEREVRTGVEFVIAEQGMRIGAFKFPVGGGFCEDRDGPITDSCATALRLLAVF